MCVSTAAPPAEAAPPLSPHAALWQQVQAALVQQVPTSEYDTWLKETALIQVADQQVIVGTPHIFARDKLADTYAPLIADALEAILGERVAVVVVLDSTLAYVQGGVYAEQDA